MRAVGLLLLAQVPPVLLDGGPMWARLVGGFCNGFLFAALLNAWYKERRHAR